MKNLLVTSMFLLLTLVVSGQSVSQTNNSVEDLSKPLNQMGNNEIHLNLLSTVIGAPEISYERFIADNMGLGISAALSMGALVDVGYTWAITPFYRLYFGQKKAAGFFIEGNMAAVGRSWGYYSSDNGYNSHYVNKRSTNLGFGMAIGWKFLSRNGFTGEVSLGSGRILGIYESYPRLGISIGKRF